MVPFCGQEPYNRFSITCSLRSRRNNVSTPLAIAVNLAGIGITATVPYIIGRFSGEETVEYMVTKYPKVPKLREIRSKNDLFFSVFCKDNQHTAF